MQNEERRVAQLPYRSLAPLPEMTGVNGYFFLVGGLDANPTPLEIQEALRYRVQDEPRSTPTSCTSGCLSRTSTRSTIRPTA